MPAEASFRAKVAASLDPTVKPGEIVKVDRKISQDYAFFHGANYDYWWCHGCNTPGSDCLEYDRFIEINASSYID